MTCLADPSAWSLGDRRSLCRYGLAHFGKSLFWYGSELLFAFYLTEIAGLAPATMGLILSLGLLVSAAIDVAVGGRLARRLTRPAETGRLQLLGAWASAITTILLLSCGVLPQGARLAAALALSVAFRVGYAFYDIPQNALLTVGAPNERARTAAASVRYIFSGLAALCIAGAMTPLLRPGSVLA